MKSELKKYATIFTEKQYRLAIQFGCFENGKVFGLSSDKNYLYMKSGNNFIQIRIDDLKSFLDTGIIKEMSQKK